MRSASLWTVVLLVSLGSGCKWDVAGAPCGSNRECPHQQYCDRQGTCQNGQTPIDYACEQIASALAQRIATCVGGDSPSWLATADATTICQQVVDSVGAGRMTYDEPALEDCKDELASRSCSDIAPSQMLENCAALQPAVVGGQACTGDLDCAGGFCDTSATCPGTCRPYVQENAACGSTDRCAPGMECRGSKCLPWVTEGQPCGGGNGNCEPTQLYCDPTNVCAKRVRSGTCNGLLCWTQIRGVQDIGTTQLNCQCAQRFNCVDPGTGAVCVPAKTLGESCTPGKNECELELACISGICAKKPVIGETCGFIGGEYVNCAEGSCRGSTCSNFIALGQSCSNNADCGPSAHCDQVCKADRCPTP